MAARIRKDDVVVVIAGKDKGRTGKVIKVLVKEERVLVEGVNMAKRHTAPSVAHPQAARHRRHVRVLEMAHHVDHHVVVERGIAIQRHDDLTGAVFQPSVQ